MDIYISDKSKKDEYIKFVILGRKMVSRNYKKII